MRFMFPKFFQFLQMIGYPSGLLNEFLEMIIFFHSHPKFTLPPIRRTVTAYNQGSVQDILNIVQTLWVCIQHHFHSLSN